MDLEQLAAELYPQLSPLDREILKAAIAGESYQTVADRLWYCHEHVRERGAALFQQLSIRLGRDISKRNFREELERVGGLISEAASQTRSGDRRRHHPGNMPRLEGSHQISLSRY